MRRGLRFFARAQCPRCKSTVDGRRTRRFVRWVSNLRRPRSTRLLDRMLWSASLALVGVTAVTALLFQLLADRWWLPTVLLFGPRWTLLLPFVPLVGLALVRDRDLLLPLGLAGCLVLGPIMGVRLGVPHPLATQANDDLVVATFNAAGGVNLSGTAGEMLAHWNADIVAFQECGSPLRDQLHSLEAWYTDETTGLCLASRYPIMDRTVMRRDNLASIGGSGLVATWVIDAGAGPFRITNVHLETPRDGLELIRRGQIRDGAEVLRQKSLLREIELRRAERWAREQGAPGIVLGDFNTPPESRHLRTYWGGWTNAFSRKGIGVGGTRLNGWIRARIDHVMVDDSWEVVASGLGSDVGSDHLPMLARLRRR